MWSARPTEVGALRTLSHNPVMRIGVDLGGTKIELIALDRDGAPLRRERVATPAGDYAATLAAITALILQAERALGERGTVGIATPGAISSRTGLIKNSNSTVLNGRPLDRDLAARLERPVRVANDANCFALSEAVDGAAAGYGVVFGVILGTGVGGGVVIERQVLTGRNRIGGEWGHNPLPWPDATDQPADLCYCGRAGCIESWLCGAGLAREQRSRGGAVLSAAQIATAAGAGDPLARASLAAYQHRLARSLASVVNILDPDAIVLGGGLSNIGALYEGLTERIAAYTFSDGCDTPVLQAAHGDSSGVRGAAWLWPQPST
jgi:fructokinase